MNGPGRDGKEFDGFGYFTFCDMIPGYQAYVALKISGLCGQQAYGHF
jgi:hypothetical protein